MRKEVIHCIGCTAFRKGAGMECEATQVLVMYASSQEDCHPVSKCIWSRLQDVVQGVYTARHKEVREEVFKVQF